MRRTGLEPASLGGRPIQIGLRLPVSPPPLRAEDSGGWLRSFVRPLGVTVVPALFYGGLKSSRPLFHFLRSPNFW